ncbi:MAG: ABC transporter permease subunit [Bacteroidota bacterium]|nr:ABC transporter permease subunit [Bacteroidota bacterium]MDP4232432.1 ABC transporter permease subunit [Bacteroidota bacterium]MDP4241568.1 ABC transporter permease subunit [Bacteroidota bacterium]MDP4286312.1 ABC transporter permease subunit [Bacteroidota bacterium]
MIGFARIVDSIRPPVSTISIALKELNDARRNRWLIGYALVLALLGIVIAIMGSSSTSGLALQMFGRTTATFVNLCLFVAPLVAITLGAGAIAGERDMGTLEHLLAQPIERSELLLGKFSGLWCAMAIATLAGFAPAGIIIGSLTGVGSFLHFLLFPMLALLVASAMLAVGLYISVRAKGRAEAQTTSILLWFVFVLAYDLLLMGSLSVVRLPAGTLGFLLFANPIDAARTLTILALDPELYVLGPAGAYLTQTLGVGTTAIMLVMSLFVWTGIPLFLSVKRFSIASPGTRKRSVGGTINHPVKNRMKSVRSSVVSGAIGAAAFAIFVSLASCGGGSDKLNQDQGAATTTTTPAPAGETAVTIDRSPEHIALGKATYHTTCAPCHGEGGKGDGPAAAALNPKPRDHTNGAYMDKLTNAHIFQVVKQGGAAFGYPTMPAQPQMADDTIKNVIAFVRSLSSTYKQ